MLVNKYGLSHVCALQEFHNIEDPLHGLPYNFPHLDIYLSGNSAIEFYFRGTKDRKLKFKNLFEYLLWAASNGQGGTFYSISKSKIFLFTVSSTDINRGFP